MRKLIVPALAFLGLGALAFANHLPVALSYIAGEEILTEVALFRQQGNTGVPAYHVSVSEVEDTLALSDGLQFTVSDGTTQEVVTFAAGDFADIANAKLGEVVSAINAQLTIAEAAADNGHFVLHGVQGGVMSTLSLQDGAGNPLDVLRLTDATVAGEKNVRLALSIPGADDHDHGDDHDGSLAHHPYLVVASATEGFFKLGDIGLPFVPDAVTLAALEAAGSGQLPGFLGTLDDHQDAQAILPADLIPATGGFPEKLFFSLLVFEHDFSAIQFASNVFTVRVVD